MLADFFSILLAEGQWRTWFWIDGLATRRVLQYTRHQLLHACSASTDSTDTIFNTL